MRVLAPKVLRGVAVAVFVGGVPSCAPPAPPVEPSAPAVARDVRVERLGQIVEASSRAIRAHHALLVRKTSQGDARCYDARRRSDADLEAAVAHQASLLATDRDAIRAWVDGKPSSFDPARDLAPLLAATAPDDPRLPFEVARARYARRFGDSPAVRALANLYETVLEIERDGSVLPAETDLYVALDLPIYDGALGLPGADTDFLAAGEELAKATCPSPFETDAAAWQIAGRKLWNLGAKKLHVRDGDVVARELAEEPEVRALLPALAALPAQRIAVLGHSFTMAAHWSSPSSFTDLTARVVTRVNPRVEFRHFTSGGLGAARAKAELYPDVLAYRPQQVLMVLLFRKEEDFTSFGDMLAGLSAAGAGVHLFDNVRAPSDRDREWPLRVRGIAEAAKAAVLPATDEIAAAPNRAQFDCLDHIHMTEPYHRLMAKAWLRYLARGAGPRGAVAAP